LVAPLLGSTLEVILIAIGDQVPEDLVDLVGWLLKRASAPVEVQVEWLEDSLDFESWSNRRHAFLFRGGAGRWSMD
jgi:hypothetical protein